MAHETAANLRIGQQALAAMLIAERDRWLLLVPVMLATGIGAYFALPAEPPAWPTAAALAVLSIACWWAFRAGKGLFAPFVGISIVLVGFGAAQVRTEVIRAPVLEAEIGPTVVTGKVRWIGAGEGRQRVILEQITIAGLDGIPPPERVRLATPVRRHTDTGDIANRAPKPGDWIRARAVLRPPSPPATPGGWDFARQAYFQRIGAVGFTYGYVEAIPAPGGGDVAGRGLAGWLSGLRHAIALKARAVDEGAAGGLAAALLTGDRSAVPKEALSAMRDSGLAHLLAISGLHIGLVAGIVFFAVRGLLAMMEPIALRYPIKKWAAAAAIAGALVYVLLAGGSIPTQRAFLMAGLILFAVIVDRASLSVRLIAWAATVLLLISPESLLGPSFQMSFAAATALIAVYEVLRRPLARWAGEGTLLRKPAVYIAGIAITTIVAGLATGPFALMHFGRFADYGLVANLLAVPLTALWVMPFGVIALVLAPIGAEIVGLVPMIWGIEGVLTVARTIANLPGAVSLAPAMPTSALIAIALGGAWLCIWRQPRLRLAGLVGLLAGGLVWMSTPRPDVLVSENGKLIAMRDAAGDLWFSTGRGSTHAASQWLRRNAQSEMQVWPRMFAAGITGPPATASPAPQTGEAAPIRCDETACVGRVKGRVISFILQPDALAEDCGRADIIVSTVPVRRRCATPLLVIDRFDLWREGAHALYVEDDGDIVVRTAHDGRGDRPWSHQHAGRSVGD